MPRIGKHSGFPCTSALGCDGRMFPLDVEHEDDKSRIVRWRECKKCGARQRTHEGSFGPVTEGPENYAVNLAATHEEYEDQPTLF